MVKPGGMRPPQGGAEGQGERDGRGRGGFSPLKLFTSGSFTATGAFASGLIIIGVMVVMLFSRITVTAGERSLEVSAPLAGSVSVPYEDIDEIRLLHRLEAGENHRGISNLSITAGTYLNDSYTYYDIYVHKKNQSSFIEVRYQDVVYLVFNLKTEAETRAMYERLAPLARRQ